MNTPLAPQALLAPCTTIALLAAFATAQAPTEPLATAALPAVTTFATDDLSLAPSRLQDAEGKRFQYRYVEAMLLFGDLDLNLAAEVSLDFADPQSTDGLFGIGHFYFATDEEDDVDVDWLAGSAGAGYHYRILEQVDLLASGEVEYGQVDSNAADDSEVGTRLHAGVRFAVHEQVELRGGVTYHSMFADRTQVEVAGQFQITPTFAFVGQIEVGEDTLFGFGGRFSF